MSWQDIPGWFEDSDGWAHDLAVAEARNGDILLDVGVAYGRSVARLARKCLESGKRLKPKGVDRWLPLDYGGPELAALNEHHGSFYRACRFMLDTHEPEASKQVELFQRDSLSAAEWFRVHGLRPWLVYLDADHSFDGVRADIAAWYRLIPEGGFLAGHDHTPSFPGVEEAVKDAFGSRYEVRGATWMARVP